jgi:Golgin subfamily A member 5
MSKESSQEASSVHVSQVQYQRQVAELTLEVSRLQAALQVARNQSSLGDQDDSNPPNGSELSHQVKLLSEEVLKLRDKLANSSGEIKTLKIRVKAASERAVNAEEQLAAATLDGIEKSISGGFPRQRHADGGAQSASIRAAMRLSPGDRTEQIGKVVDVVDTFAVSTGKYLRRNPLARAGFILYLVLVHLWTFLLLFFHAHNLESKRVEFGSNFAVGPDALVEHHNVIADRAAAEIRSAHDGALSKK